jgi:AraC family transcriptional regulator
MSHSNPKLDAYARRFGKVFEYIDAHLDEELSVESLSRVANFSRFHFHRQFSAYTGIGVFKYVQLMRLQRAARRLVQRPDERIMDIALDARFESPEAFARAFKRAFGQTPSAFRLNPGHEARFSLPHLTRSHAMNVNIVNFPETRIAALEHLGPPARLDNTVQTFIGWRRASGLSPVESSRTFGIPYNNPDTVAPEDFRFDVCGEVAVPVTENAQGVRTKVIPAGRCAVVRHHGSPDHIGESIYPIYRDWLPQSGEELRDFPLFFHYLSVYPETPQDLWQTDIYVPLK